MIKDIKYSGYSAQPSDYECHDGDLAASINLVPEDGALKPIGKPKVIRQLTANSKVIFIHKTSAFTHYIVDCGNNKLGWLDAEKSSSEVKELSDYRGALSHVNAIGNTLLIFTDNAILYYLWKVDVYTFLGDHLPNVELSFGLKGRPLLYSVCGEKPSTFKITFDDIAESDILLEWPKDIQSKITSQVMAKFNKFLADQSVNKGRFCLPFLLRYALRLYDGSLVCHSAPILMNPSTKAAPVVLWNKITGSGKHGEAECDIMLVSASIDFCPYDLDGLQDWTDIVKSVDVFISKPIYGYDQNGQCTSFKESGDLDTKFIGTMDRVSADWDIGDRNAIYTESVYEDEKGAAINTRREYKNIYCQYLEWRYSELYTIFYSKDREYPNTSIRMPEFSEEKIGEQIKDVHNFYFLHSITMDDLKKYDPNADEENHNLDIIVPDDYLQSLVNREVMTDDYLTNDSLVAEYSHTYNSRLNLVGIRRKLFPGFSPACLFARTTMDMVSLKRGEVDHYKNIRLDIMFPHNKRSIDTYIDVFIKENGETYKVSAKAEAHYMAHYLSVTRYPSEKDEQLDTNAFLLRNSWGCFVFYPNVNAFRMRITDDIGSLDIDLKPHDFLNGAYALLDYDLERTPKTTETTVTASANIIDTPNKIYTSEVNNPFYFPLLGINTVGTGRILGISSAVKALSEGQFGQFPLYAFTTEGVWALEVSNTGTYSAKQPVTRDVCINPDSITQIDSAVLFATRRGIMHISGSTTLCITDSIKTETPFDVLSLPHMKELHDKLDHDPTMGKCLPILPFTEFLKSCRMIYDYVHQRIIVYNPAVTYVYVYSLKSQMWGMIYSNIADNVNSYPNALAVDTEGNLVDFSIIENVDIASMLVSRPIKLETPDVLKTMDTVIQRGHFQKGHVQSVLYGSRDLYNWHLVWSSKDHYLRGFRGTPYKYFRIALLCNLSPDESIFGASLQFTPRLTNQPR